MEIYEAIILTIITAATPLLLAACGELVAERSGILNLGVEGMMIMGAVSAFATAYTTVKTVDGLTLHFLLQKSCQTRIPAFWKPYLNMLLLISCQLLVI